MEFPGKCISGRSSIFERESILWKRISLGGIRHENLQLRFFSLASARFSAGTDKVVQRAISSSPRPGSSPGWKNSNRSAHRGTREGVRFATDDHGFLWCATSDGVARFDGYELKVYPENLADSAGVVRAQMQAIAVDGDGFVWGATRDAGLKKLDPATGRSRWYRGRPDDSTSIGTGATRLLVTSDGQLWAGGRFGLARYERETDSFVRYNLPPDLPQVWEGVCPRYIITSLCELDRSIWVGLIGGGLAEFNRDTGVWKRYTHNPSTGAGPSHDMVRAVCADRRGRLWIGTRTGLDRYNPRADTWDHFTISQNGISPYRNDAVLRTIPACVGCCRRPVWRNLDRSRRSRPLQVRSGDRHVSATFATIARTRIHFHTTHSSGWTQHAPGRNANRHRRHTQYGNTIIWIPYGFEGTHRVIVRKDPCTSVVIRHEAGRIPPVVSALSRDYSGKIWGGVTTVESGSSIWRPAWSDGIQLRRRGSSVCANFATGQSWCRRGYRRHGRTLRNATHLCAFSRICASTASLKIATAFSGLVAAAPWECHSLPPWTGEPADTLSIPGRIPTRPVIVMNP